MKKKAVLIIDGGGRGSALVAAYAKSNKVGKILAIPGNDLMQIVSKKRVTIYKHLKTTSIPEILEICKKEKVDLVDVAQDNAVQAGLVDELLKNNIPAFGPTRLAGQIEWDKAWARKFMWKYKIPHPTFTVFHSQKEGISFVKKQKDQAWFVKANGLVEGKGALPARNNKEAIEKIQEMKKFGDMGKTFLLEQWLVGEEFSSFALCDGENFHILGNAQDHKRMFNFDQGENTGGMGCSTPPLLLTPKLQKEIKEIFQKALSGLKKENRHYQGILYLGGIVVNEKIFVIEFNARWGDPEAQVMVPGIKNDFFEMNMAIAEGKLKKIKIRTDNKARVAVTGSLRSGIEPKERQLFGIPKVLKLKDITIFGTRVQIKNKKYFVTSGRLFHLVAEGKDVIGVRRKVYEAMALLFIEGNNLHFRTDIGYRDVSRHYEKE